MTEETTVVEETTEKTVPSQLKLIRGRMPLPLVWNIRFVELKPSKNAEGETIIATDTEVSKKYFTTPGKILDIRKNSNFKYITKDTTFDQGDIDAAKAQLTKNVNEGKKRGATEASHDFTMEDAQPLFDLLDTLVSDKSSVDADRSAYNEANPRKKAEKKDAEQPAPAPEPEASAEEEQELDEELDELMEG